MKSKYSYDPDCELLAEHFIVGEERAENDVRELAQAIQDAVENWFAGRRADGQ